MISELIGEKEELVEEIAKIVVSHGIQKKKIDDQMELMKELDEQTENLDYEVQEKREIIDKKDEEISDLTVQITDLQQKAMANEEYKELVA